MYAWITAATLNILSVAAVVAHANWSDVFVAIGPPLNTVLLLLLAYRQQRIHTRVRATEKVHEESMQDLLDEIGKPK